jgi:hypothetical protein
MKVEFLVHEQNKYIKVNNTLLTSPYSPEDENKRFLNQIDYKLRNTTIIIFGLGTGQYLVELTMSIHKSNTIVIVEPEQEIIDYFLLHNKVNNKVNIVNSYDELNFFLDTNKLNSRYKLIYCYMNYRNLYAGLYKQIITIIRNDSILKLMDEATTKHFEKEFTKNIFVNYIVNEFDIAINELKGKYSNIPALIVSGGPSLDKNIGLISEFNGLVFTGGRTINEFLEKKIKVDFMVSIDPGNPAFELIKKSVNVHKMPPLFTYIEGNYKVVKNHNNIKILMNSIHVPLNDFNNSVDTIPSGPSVANVTVAIADYLGCNPIVMIGQDLAYTDGKHHAITAISSFDKINFDNDSTIEVDGFFNSPVKTTAPFYSMLVWFENWISKSNKKFFNCTEGGVWIHGCEHMKLSEYIKESKCSTTIMSCFNLEDFINNNKKFKTKKPINEYSNKLITLTNKMKQAVYYSNKILSSVKINNENSLQSHLLKLEKIDTFVMNEMKNDTMLNYIFASAKVDFENEKRKFSKNDKLGIAMSNLKFYESLHTNFAYLLTWFEEMKNESDY